MSEPVHPQQRLALTLIWLVPSLWTVNYIVARLAPGVIGPYLLALGRWAIAGVVLVALCARRSCGASASHLPALVAISGSGRAGHADIVVPGSTRVRARPAP